MHGMSGVTAQTHTTCLRFLHNNRDICCCAQVNREGCLLLEFAPVATAQAQTQFGQRSYAWDKKTTFALKVCTDGHAAPQQHSMTFMPIWSQEAV
jgi:hypothetical protein